MKTISILLVIGALSLLPAARGQDAAVEERLNKLTASVQDLLAAQAVQQKRIADLAKDLENLREQTSKPVGNFASQEAFDKLAKSVQDIDKNRISDNEKILAAIEKLAKAGAGTRTGNKPNRPPPEAGEKAGNSGGDTGFYYVIQSGDTLSAICQAYREKGVKVTPEQIVQANHGLKATSLQVGQKIFIPDTRK